jgi:hypothetical protein
MWSWDLAETTARCAAYAVSAGAGKVEQDEGEQAAQAELLRCIFGRPLFRPITVPVGLLAWNDGLVISLAQAAYDERTLPEGHLDLTRLAVLADALEDAGCSAPDLLGHLRGPGPHVRGCWAVDLILGKS